MRIISKVALAAIVWAAPGVVHHGFMVKYRVTQYPQWAVATYDAHSSTDTILAAAFNGPVDALVDMHEILSGNGYQGYMCPWSAEARQEAEKIEKKFNRK